MTLQEQRDKAERKYHSQMKKAECHTDFMYAATEYIWKLDGIIHKAFSRLAYAEEEEGE